LFVCLVLVLSVPAIETQFPGHAAYYPDTMPTALSWLPNHY